MVEPITVDLDDLMIEKYEEFFGVYKHQSSIFTDLTKRDYLGKANAHTCRFCGYSYPKVKFKRHAHVIPQSIGNKYLHSHFECDDCNKFFGNTYEDSFANFLSNIRPFAGIANSNKGSKKRVKHRELRTGLEIRSSATGIEVLVESGKESPVTFEVDNAKMRVVTTIPVYRPLYVFKTLMKIGLSMVDDSELSNFILSRSFLLDNSQNHKVKGYGLFSVFVSYVPGPTIWTQPFAILHTKLDSAKCSLYPEKVLSLYFASRVFQIFIPFNRNDEFLIGQKFRLPLAPLPINKSYFSEFGEYSIKRFDFSSDAIARNSKEEIVLSLTDFKFFQDPLLMPSNESGLKA